MPEKPDIAAQVVLLLLMATLGTAAAWLTHWWMF